MAAPKTLLAAVILSFAWGSVCLAGGDEIEMRDGTRVKGDIIAQNSAQLYLATPDGLKKINTLDIRKISFGARPPGTPLVTSSLDQPAADPAVSPESNLEPGLKLTFKKE